MRKSAITQKIKKARGKKLPFPKTLDPMLATKVNNAFDDPDFIFEIKFDGYRILAYKENSRVLLRTRSNQDYSKNYSTITQALKTLPYSLILDGEVVMLDQNGRPSFDLLQQVKKLGPERLVYCVFDLLWFEGYSLLEVPLITRKKILHEIFSKIIPNISVSEHIDTDGETLFASMLEQGLEGIVAKKKSSLYSPGIRTTDWLKIQTKFRQEFVIGGWTESGSGRPFRSLMFGYYDAAGKLRYYGHSGAGYDDKTAARIKQKLLKLEIKKKPFINATDSSTPEHWVKPVLVAEFEYATTTHSGKIRKPAIFKGLREDKKASEVRLEQKQVLDQNIKKSKPEIHKQDVRNRDSNWPEVMQSLSKGSVNELDVEGQKVQLNNIEKKLWSRQQVTRADLIRYYIEMADYILPYLRDRPLSLHIKHNAVNAPGLYIKAMEGNQPSWAKTFVTERKHKKTGKGKFIDYLLCKETATLVYLVNLGCIDFNPWNSTIAHPSSPDYLVIDLDPTGSPFSEVVLAAKACKRVLDGLGLTGFPKTSGKTGIHIFIPVQPVFTYPQARSIAGQLCKLVHEEVPEITTLEDSVSMRANKVFIDDNQNDLADTVASAYSVRPNVVPTVSTPLSWKEINARLDPERFTIFTIQSRLKKTGDLFRGIFSDSIRKKNTAVLRKYRDSSQA